MKDKQFFAYSASAGSGKTYALALRYIALLFLGQSPSKILAATFTKKAANEMKERILKLLRNLEKEQGFLDSLVKEYGLDKEEILANRQKVLNTFLKVDNHIVTLDSFFTSILRSSALKIGLEPDFAIKDRGEKRVKELFLNNIDRYSQVDNLVKLSLNLQKRRSEEIIDLLKSLFNIDALLPKQNYQAYNLDAIVEKVDTLRVELLNLVKNSGASKSAVKNFEESDFRAFIKKSLFEKDSLSEHRFYKKYIQKEPRIEYLFQELKEEIAKFHKSLEESIFYYLFNVYDIYKNSRIEYAKGKSELNFNDILYFTHRVLSSEITKEFLYFKLDTKFEHILLDEFQDTSALQYLILEPLIDEIFAGEGQSSFRTFFYVGDVKQSLYRFRGGVEDLFDYVAQKYNIQVAHLDTNYRSAKLIVEKTNEWFADKIKNFKKQKAKSNIQGYVELLQSEELLKSAKEKVDFLLKSGVALEDIAILVFANKDGIALQEYLKKEGIDSILKTSSSLKYNQKIAALVNVLKYFLTKERLYLEPFLQKANIDNFDDSWFKFYMTPYEVLYKLVKDYKYFDSDLNILKLLDFAREFNTIEHFLDEFENSNIELAKSSKSGLEIMTIHGSKGLEFKYVIVLDRLSQKPPNRDLLLFKNKTPITIDKIYYKHSKKEYFLPDYEKALKREKELQLKDRLNLLYVALTRAELGMIIIKKQKSSEFDLLELEPIKLGKIEAVSSTQSQELKELNPVITYYGVQELKVKEEDSSDELIDFNAVNFGEALHYTLEMIDFNNKNSLSYAFEALMNRYGYILSSEQIVDIKRRIELLLNNSEFLNLIKDAKLYKEQPISYEKNLYQIDLLVKKENINIVFDYKSSKKFTNKHKAQVKNYVEAIKDIDKKATNGYILYLLQDRLEIESIQ